MNSLQIFKQITFGLFISILVTSCVGNKKIVELTKTINERKAIEKGIETKITKMDSVRENKITVGELDEKSNSSIKKILESEKKGVADRTAILNQMNDVLTSKTRIKIKDFEKMQINVSTSNNLVAQKNESVEFVNQLLKQQTFIKFNSAAFFEAGGFKIPETKIAEAKQVFSPIIDSMFIFVKKFPKLKLNSSIIATGYADGTGFGPGPLVDQLTLNIGKEVASKEELNAELSKLRAEEVASVLTQIFNDKISTTPNTNQFNIQFFKIGKGEEFPNKKITDYQIDDERRRIVVIYWNALPE